MSTPASRSLEIHLRHRKPCLSALSPQPRVPRKRPPKAHPQTMCIQTDSLHLKSGNNWGTTLIPSFPTLDDRFGLLTRTCGRAHNNGVRAIRALNPGGGGGRQTARTPDRLFWEGPVGCPLEVAFGRLKGKKTAAGCERDGKAPIPLLADRPGN